MSVAVAARCGSLAAVEAALQSGNDVNGCVCSLPAVPTSLASDTVEANSLHWNLTSVLHYVRA